MRKVIFIALFILVKNVIAQEAKYFASQHIFILCEENGLPFNYSGQHYYFVFHKNNQLMMICGSSIEKAIANRTSLPSSSKSGVWKDTANKMLFSWSDGKKSEEWILDSNSGNFKSLSGMILKNLGQF